MRKRHHDWKAFGKIMFIAIFIALSPSGMTGTSGTPPITVKN
jgi:hypothetical protein